jgi:hypothetical protein
MPTICSSDSHWLSTRVYTHLLGSQKINRIDLLYNQGSSKYLKSQRWGSSFMKTIDSLRVLKELELMIR